LNTAAEGAARQAGENSRKIHPGCPAWKASADFQKILDHKGRNWGPLYSLSSLGLARAAVLADDTAKAKKAYQGFLAVWKDADPDMPLLIAACKEFAALTDGDAASPHDRIVGAFEVLRAKIADDNVR
jgi:hypothetical protein